MMNKLIRFGATAIVVAPLLSGCAGEEVVGENRRANMAPTVWLASAPPEGTESGYLVHLYWGGWDPDGQISHYEYCITNNETGQFVPADTVGPDKWNDVFSNDSTFLFTADGQSNPNNNNMVQKFERSHTFFIRAVDREGQPSSAPAYRSFTATTLSPEVRLDIPLPGNSIGTPAQMPAIATYRWTGADYINNTDQQIDPAEVRHILKKVQGNDYDGALSYIQNNPDASEWSDWLAYDAPGDTGRAWTTPPIDFGLYVFAVQARDEAGAVTPVFQLGRNARRIQVLARSTGPKLTVSNQFMGSVLSTYIATPAAIVDLPAGVPLSFTMQADARDYGGTVVAYRYGWDVIDPADPDQFDVDWTPPTSSTTRIPPRTFYFGSHLLLVDVIDNSGVISRAQIRVNIVQFDMGRDLLVVDDYVEPEVTWITSAGASPSDEEHDQFWIDALADAAGFNPDLDMLSIRSGRPLSIVQIANYKNIIWDALGGYGRTGSNRPKLGEVINFRSKNPSLNAANLGSKISPNLISLFMRAGGHVLICGEQPMTQTITPQFFGGAAVRYPMIPLYELEGDQSGSYDVEAGRVGDQSSIYEDFCVNVLDVAYTTFNNLRKNENGCDTFGYRDIDPVANGLRSAIPVDPNFPQLDLRPETANPGMTYASKGLRTELYDPPFFRYCPWFNVSRACFSPIWVNGTANANSSVYGAPIAFWTTTYADRVPERGGGVAARSAIWGFEPAYFNPSQVKQALEVIIFDEWKMERR